MQIYIYIYIYTYIYIYIYLCACMCIAFVNTIGIYRITNSSFARMNGFQLNRLSTIPDLDMKQLKLGILYNPLRIGINQHWGRVTHHNLGEKTSRF